MKTKSTINIETSIVPIKLRTGTAGFSPGIINGDQVLLYDFVLKNWAVFLQPCSLDIQPPMTYEKSRQEDMKPGDIFYFGFGDEEEMKMICSYALTVNDGFLIWRHDGSIRKTTDVRPYPVYKLTPVKP